MDISVTLQKYLANHGVAYDIVSHRHTATSMNAASAAHIPAEKVAKPVILEDETGYLMAVIPASQHLKINEVNHVLGRDMELATEAELRSLFFDCELGAIPPVGEAYGMETIIDESLIECPDIYLESGNHEDLIHIRGASFTRLMQHAPHARIS